MTPPPSTEGRRASDFLTELFRTPLDPGYADAARRRAREPAPPAWRRRADQSLLALALVAIGLLLAVAYKYAVAVQPEASRARAGLIDDVRARRAAAADMQRRADRLRDQVARQRDEALGGGGEEVTTLRNLAALTGLSRVRGDGAVVRLVDAPPPVDPVTGRQGGSNPGRVLDQDLQHIANELWRLGAEAIAINGQRLTATSTIRAAGDAILVDFRPITAPYEVAAIGPDDLAEQFEESTPAKRFRKYAEAYRMQFSVKQRSNLTLPAAADPQLRHARIPPPVSPPRTGPTQRPPASPVPSASGGGR